MFQYCFWYYNAYNSQRVLTPLQVRCIDHQQIFQNAPKSHQTTVKPAGRKHIMPVSCFSVLRDSRLAVSTRATRCWKLDSMPDGSVQTVPSLDWYEVSGMATMKRSAVFGEPCWGIMRCITLERAPLTELHVPACIFCLLDCQESNWRQSGQSTAAIENARKIPIASQICTIIHLKFP